MGSGQVVDQGARLVDKALASGHIFEQEGWQHIEPAFSKHTVHFIGLLSDGGVHSRYDQLLGLLNGVRAAQHSSSPTPGSKPAAAPQQHP